MEHLRCQQKITWHFEVQKTWPQKPTGVTWASETAPDPQSETLARAQCGAAHDEIGLELSIVHVLDSVPRGWATAATSMEKVSQENP